jgi:hypothetical protein
MPVIARHPNGTTISIPGDACGSIGYGGGAASEVTAPRLQRRLIPERYPIRLSRSLSVMAGLDPIGVGIE